MGRLGAVEGPEMFRRALAKLPSTRPFEDCGDIVCIGDELENCQKAFANCIAALPKDSVVIGVGGGHEIAWAHYSGLKQIHDGPVGIINIDAHFDLRPLISENRGTSGTSFLQIAHNYPFDYTVIGIQKLGNTQGLFQKAEELKSKIITAEDIHLNGINGALQAIDETLRRNDKIYLSICLDVFAAPYAPGVSAPQPLGLLPWHVIPLLKRVQESGKVVGVDIAELNPHFDRDDMTALLAASLASYIL
jgi:formiminoglutamase